MIGWSSSRGRAVLVPAPRGNLFHRLVDEFTESYVRWREECRSVRTAYERWVDCPSPDRPLAFAAYRAALDREEKAARVHSAWCARLGGLSA